MVTVPCPFDEEKVLRLVRYLCACGHSQPLCRLYFCRYCLELRCGFCVSHEVDSHYCPHCLENMPSAEARLKKNRCANCFDCPSCANTLTTRATTSASAAAAAAAAAAGSGGHEKASPPKKMYYLFCHFCRWTTRDIGLPDQPVASGGWPEPENPDAARFAALHEHFRALAQREKMEKETRRFVGKKLSYMQLADRYGLSGASAMARRKAGLPPLASMRAGGGGDHLDANAAAAAAPSEAKDIEEVESVDFKELFSTPVDLCRTTKIGQRMSQLDTQPDKMADVYPRHKHLVVKRSQRCRQCEHNLSKPEYNPTSIKFKIQLAAFYHVPEVVIFQLSKEPLRAGHDTTFVLKVTNPTQHPTTFELIDLDEFAAGNKEGGDNDEAAAAAASATDASSASGADDNKNTASLMSASTILKQPSLVKAGKSHAVSPNAGYLALPDRKRIYLPARDDTAEYDDSGLDLTGIEDDHRVVVWRKSNKVGLLARSRIDPDLKPGAEVVTGFALKYEYTNTLTSLEQKDVARYDITVPVYVVLGKVAGNQ